MTTAPATNQAQALDVLPKFWDRLFRLYLDSVSHSFLLYGNVFDLQCGGVNPATPGRMVYQSLRMFLAARFQRGFDLIVVVNPADGLVFIDPKYRTLFCKAVGLISDAPAAKSEPEKPQAGGRLAGIKAKQAVPEGKAPDVKLPREMGAITELLNTLLTEPYMVPDGNGGERPLRAAVICEYFELMLPTTELERSNGAILSRFLQWARTPTIGGRHLLLCITEVLLSINPELRRASARWEPIELELPDERARRVFIEDRLLQFGPKLELADGLDADTIAKMTGALRLLDIEDAFFRGAGGGTLTRDLLLERKALAVAKEYGDVIRISEPRFTLDDLGVAEYRRSFYERSVIQPWRRGALRIGTILYPGPPGTGKTLESEAVAGSAGVMFVLFDLSKIYGKYVGDTERAMARIEQAFRVLAPCIVLFDEVDQQLGRGTSGGSNVDNRVFARVLTFMEDPWRRGKVLILMSSNRPDNLDAAVRSRCDKVIPMLPGDPDERDSVLHVLLRDHAGATWREMDPEETQAVIIEATEGWTNRQLRDLATFTGELIDSDNLPPEEALHMALDNYIPATQDYQRMIDLALAEASDLRLVPAWYRERLKAQRVRSEQQTPVDFNQDEQRAERRDWFNN